MKENRKQKAKRNTPAAEKYSSACFNKECKLKKEKGCSGFEACPGYKGR
ncbi:MAG: hypothetical protein K8I29_13865 [Alphaproteobacteria bacterium]|uniref:Uncharacterized protein n=1 Tax=Candidatus Nitrobium versatile TaxID=2884831 RepID=A0A953J7R8_9BACT|nr:hypothetical protein [Candidatus Nitrobium versatile]